MAVADAIVATEIGESEERITKTVAASLVQDLVGVALAEHAMADVVAEFPVMDTVVDSTGNAVAIQGRTPAGLHCQLGGSNAMTWASSKMAWAGATKPEQVSQAQLELTCRGRVCEAKSLVGINEDEK